LNSRPDQKVKLSDFRGNPVILAFYPADWSPVCGDQMSLYNEILAEFRHHGAQLGISVDGVWCHRAFADARNLHFPLLADFEPKGDVARAFGVYRTGEGIECPSCGDAPVTLVESARDARRGGRGSVNPGADGILP
jgi:peroxiredoxin